MSETEPSERSKKVKEATDEFIKASQEMLSPAEFLSGTVTYSGSIHPSILTAVDSWKTSGAIPVSASSLIYNPGTLLDLSPIAESIAKTPGEIVKFENVRKKTEDVIKEEELYDRVAEYQDSLMRVASCSKILQGTINATSTSGRSWIEIAKTNLEWIKKAVTKSIARIYQAFGKLFDKVTDKIDEIAGLLSRWANSLKNQFIEKLRELSEGFLGLVNNLIAGLFGWIATLRKIAQDRGFRLTKVTLTIDPVSFENVTAFGFSIPVPILNLPKIEMEFA